jgi:hypothetical protein
MDKLESYVKSRQIILNLRSLINPQERMIYPIQGRNAQSEWETVVDGECRSDHVTWLSGAWWWVLGSGVTLAHAWPTSAARRARWLFPCPVPGIVKPLSVAPHRRREGNTSSIYISESTTNLRPSSWDLPSFITVPLQSLNLLLQYTRTSTPYPSDVHTLLPIPARSIQVERDRIS